MTTNDERDGATKRQRMDVSFSQAPACINVLDADTLPTAAVEEKHPKRKVALLLSFCGTGYSGMQMYVPKM